MRMIMQHKLFLVALAALFMNGSLSKAQDYTPLTESDLSGLKTTSERARVSVHDPSIVHLADDTYYLVGTMRAFARSNDHMQNWTSLNGGEIFGTVKDGSVVSCAYEDAFATNQTKQVRALVNGQVQVVDFGTYNVTEWAHADQEDWELAGNMWAPDLIYNPTMKKWCMYQSINGDYWHSVIVLLTADKITGPYVYQGPVHFSGFRNTTTPELNWKKTDLEVVLGEQSTLPARYNKGNNWPNYWTNDIDPCTFFDEDGQLWMVYGSWFGGLFIIKLDKETGLRDYTVTYPIENDNNGRALSDPYFGKRIAGGYWSSGEGAYIKHIGDYYYLFVSYGGFAPDGGYEMRTFRCKTPDGVYLDATNHDACYHDRGWTNYGPNADTNGGMKLLGAYNNWGFQTMGECAQGHNSVTVDEQGRAFVIYHTKFNDGMPQNGFHSVRVRQLFLNKNGWLCAAPFEFDGETDTDASLAAGCRYTENEMVGSYDVLIHKYKMDHENFEEVTPIRLTLGADKKVTGDRTGTWSMTAGTSYIQLTVGGVVYDGVVVQQQVDGSTYKALTFTGTASSGVSIWGWKMEPQSAIAYLNSRYEMPVKQNQTVNKNLILSGEGAYGATIEWESSNPDVISNIGQYNPADELTNVVLACHIRSGAYTYDRTYNVRASKAATVTGNPTDDIVAYYDFEAKPTINYYNEDQKFTYNRISTASTIPTLEEDLSRYGQVVHLYAGIANRNSYARTANPLKGATDLTGFTISAWVRRADVDDLTGTLWCFANQTTYKAKQHLFLTGNGYIGFTNETDEFAYNEPDETGSNATGYIKADEWQLVTVTISATDGIKLYVNGTAKTLKTFTSTAGTAARASESARLFDYQKVLDMVASANYLVLGSGGGYGSAEAYYDDLLVYKRALTATDVRGLTTLMNRKSDLTPNGTGIQETVARPHTVASDAIYSISGQRVTKPRKGIYIIGGRKVLIK